jgi:hypothetical protein
MILPVDGAPGYFVSDDGRVFSERRGARRELRPFPAKGYLAVALMVEGRRCNFRVAALVARAFIGPRPDGQEVRHLNGIRIDNCSSNLAYGTSLDNKGDARLHGTLPRGERNGRARLSRDDVLCIRDRHARGETQASLAKEYSVAGSTISYAVRGETWGD